ncbi:hypothetical protein BDR04DRAFT_1235484 [Suillus decipiens]|nr:hypothetical protein BDR04DRAFT_1235484 [Suillus decipiens]
MSESNTTDTTPPNDPHVSSTVGPIIIFTTTPVSLLYTLKQLQLDLPQWAKPMAIGYTHLRREHRYPGGVLLHGITWHGIIIYGFTDIAFPASPMNITRFIVAIIVLNGVFWNFVTGYTWGIRKGARFLYRAAFVDAGEKLMSAD